MGPKDGGPQDAPGRQRNRAFEKFYWANLVETGHVKDSEWEIFLDSLSKPLPVTLWITPTDRDAEKVRRALRQYKAAAEEASSADTDIEQRVSVQMLPWMPEEMGWRVDIPKTLLRKDPRFKPLHQMLIDYTAKGTINRMEEVSMLPVTLLDIQAGHRCLDSCASPGSKTAQMLACLAHANFRKWGRGLESICNNEVKKCQPFLLGRIDYSSDEGCVVANEISAERAGMLVHQIARHQALYPLVVFTSHDARYFPSIREADGQTELLFDRILCDVMCSSDGTLRKAPHLWREWSTKLSMELHADQLAVALRAARLLRPGGRMVYSTCSLSPVENEAVVSEILQAASLALVDVRGQLAMRTSPGLQRWKVAHNGQLFESHAAALAAGVKLHKGFFPPEAPHLLPELSKCLRILPHHNDTGGFFVAVFEKHTLDHEEDGTAACRGYDSDRDEDGEESARRKQLEKLEQVATAGSAQERAKAEARRERARTSGSLARELARYTCLASMPQAAALRSFYGLHETFPEKLLFSRHHLELNADGELLQTHQGEANQLLLLAGAAAEILQCGTGAHAKRKLKIIAGGLRVFEKDRFEVPERCTSFRFAQEGLELLLPYIGQRIAVLEDVADTRRLLNQRDSATAQLVSKGKEVLETLGPGGCVLLLGTMIEGDLLPVSALRTQKAVNLFVNDITMPLVREACGIPADCTAEQLQRDENASDRDSS